MLCCTGNELLLSERIAAFVLGDLGNKSFGPVRVTTNCVLKAVAQKLLCDGGVKMHLGRHEVGAELAFVIGTLGTVFPIDLTLQSIR